MANESYPKINLCQPPRTVDAELRDVARDQHGLVSTTQLHAAGLTGRAITQRTAAGRLTRLHHGVYAVGHDAPSQHARWLAAVMAGGPGAALASFDAALLWGIDRGSVLLRRRRALPADIFVLVPATRRPRQGVGLRRARSLAPRDVCVREGITTTSVARTCLDLADHLDAADLSAILGEAAYHRLLKAPDVEDLLRRTQGRRAASVLADALALHMTGSAGPRSDLERRVLRLVQAGGHPDPLVNVRVAVDQWARTWRVLGRTGRAAAREVVLELDMFWPALAYAIEVDGPVHDEMRRREDDAVRDVLLASVGVRTARIASRSVTAAERRGVLPERITRELARGGQRK